MKQKAVRASNDAGGGCPLRRANTAGPGHAKGACSSAQGSRARHIREPSAQHSDLLFLDQFEIDLGTETGLGRRVDEAVAVDRDVMGQPVFLHFCIASGNSNRRCAVSADVRTRYQALDFDSSVTGRQLEALPNMIQPPLLGVVNAASAVSARTLTCRAPAVPRSCSMLSVYMAVRGRPVPRLPPLEQNGCGPSTLISSA